MTMHPACTPVTEQTTEKASCGSILSRLRTLLVVICATVLPLLPGGATHADEQLRIAREMIQVLDAYAVYKMGQFDEAFERYRVLAEAGNRQGMLNIGNMYSAGLSVGKNPTEALLWYQRAADAGDPIGQFEVARAYEHGLGTQADPQQADYWYQLAAENDNSDAQWVLGKRLYDRASRLDGLSWIRTAARTGDHPSARLFLAELNGSQVTAVPDQQQRDVITDHLQQIDKAARAKNALGVIAQIDAEARIRVRLPNQEAWTTLSRDELQALWQAAFDQVDKYWQIRSTPDFLLAEDRILVFSQITETLTSASTTRTLLLDERATYRIDGSQAQVESLWLNISETPQW